MPILIREVGLMDRGFFAVWSDELQRCVGTGTTQKNDVGLFAPFG